MKSSALFIFCIFFFLNGYAQNYSEIDNYAKSIEYKDNYTVSILAHKLTDKFEKEEDKVRAIFIWITENIEYATDYKHSKNSEETLKRKKGVCNDYTVLFKDLCKESGITAYKITGYGKNRESQIGTPFFSNHAWNAVEINGKKFLLDITWASGGIGVGGYQKVKNERYYLCPPEIFILDHFPKDVKWQLLSSTVDEQTFIDNPLIEDGYVTYGIKELKPMKGYIIDSVLSVSFKSEKEINWISVLKYPVGVYGTARKKEVNFNKENNTYSFKYTIDKESAYRLTFYIENQQLATYKLVSEDYKFEIPKNIDQYDEDITFKYILNAFKSKNLAQINEAVYSGKKYTSFSEIEYGAVLLKILSKWNGDFSGSIMHNIKDSNSVITHYFIYRVDAEYSMRLIQIDEKYYFHSIIKGIK